MFRTIEWLDDTNQVRLVDQTKLPLSVEHIVTDSHKRIAESIKVMEIRGAPAIGAAAGMGMALAALESNAKTKEELVAHLETAADTLNTRPTAVNLTWATRRMLDTAKSADGAVQDIVQRLINEAKEIAEEDVRMSRRMGENALELIRPGFTIQTICNAGSLATVHLGTVGAVIRVAHEAYDGQIKVYAAETRPRQQGARLTVFEFMEDGIDTTLITDGMIGTVFRDGRVDCCVVGADRILRTGHVINKIGTYTMAIVARHHKIPFYCVVPMSTVDWVTNPEDVIIEERDPDEIRIINGEYVTVPDAKVYNPAFDMTPPELVDAIITDRGVIHRPDEKKMKRLLQ
ncbi:MAG: S-methyl-5-thioribose-1-phosphate isomerase [Candidatus Thorarchaeota archaeon]|nr:MAG: S-methyl-5-thioribose-1-phosphate isomerase [Candidatus Thorarchaeota archaeon]RLI60301.1 MAG: S-methyl-5-thioribose-1-phosphate isomerase [Candidatus Thorarchaeota archaeon]